MPKRLILLRHAKSDWAESGLSDIQRPLNARGRRDAPRMARWLEEFSGLPEQIVSSSSVRTRETCARMQEAWKPTVPVEFRDILYHAPNPIYFQVGSQFSESVRCGMIVGHNPGISSAAHSLVPEIDHLPTCSMVIIDLQIERWRDVLKLESSMKPGAVSLVRFQIPKALDD